MASWWAAESSSVSNQTPFMRDPDSQSSSRGCRPSTAPHWAPTRSSTVIPTVQLSRHAIPTIWSVVWMSFGRRILGMASISSRVSNIFMPMGVVRSRNSRLRSSTVLFQSIGAPARWTDCSVVVGSLTSATLIPHRTPGQPTENPRHRPPPPAFCKLQPPQLRSASPPPPSGGAGLAERGWVALVVQNELVRR